MFCEVVMKITETLLSIPPYISTTWNHIASLHYEREKLALIISLKNGTEVAVPHLTPAELNEIFDAHSRYSQPSEDSTSPSAPLNFTIPLRSDSPIDSIAPAMQHNPQQQNFPTLPPEILDKIVGIAKALGVGDPSTLTPPEPDCSCVYCQLAHALLKGQSSETAEEEVTEADLHFRDWEVKQTSDHLYIVTNPLEKGEQYTVFLGEPLGCTCGEKHCEHIKAVLCSD
jgi:hypothetical protein